MGDISKLLYWRNFTSRLASEIWDNFEIPGITSGFYAKYHIQIMLLFVYTTTCKGLIGNFHM